MSLIRFIFSKSFLINLLIAVIVIAAAAWATLHYLDSYTMHGESITVPDFKGFKVEELDEFVADKPFRYEITDSIYDLSRPKGTVIDQNPKPESQVKENRKIYLTVNAKLPPMVKLPNLKDMSLRQAMAIIESYGLKVGDLHHRPDPCTNCVLGIEIDGKEVEPGKTVVKNTTIDLILGEGESSELIPVPFLLNLTEEQVSILVKSMSLNIGAVNYEGCETEEDSLNALVYKQSPESKEDEAIHLGGVIDIWLTKDSTKLRHFLPDSLFNKKEVPADE